MPDLFVQPHETKKELSSEVKNFPKTSVEKLSTTPADAKAMAGKENHIHALSHYCENPTFLSLEGKNITTNIRLFVRRHIVTNLPWIVTTIVLLLIPFLLQIIVSLSGMSFATLPGNFVTVFLLMYYLITLIYAFISFLDWFYNIILITNTEIIDVDYSDVVYHNVAATKVSLIEDVNYTQLGFIRGLFNFGDLFVQTAGGHENIEALAIPQPAKITRIVLDFIGKGEHS